MPTITEEYIKENPVDCIVLNTAGFDEEWSLYNFIIRGGNFINLKGHYDSRSEWKSLSGIKRSINAENKRNIGCSLEGNYIYRAVILERNTVYGSKRYSADIEYGRR